jgi:tetratricopeptide (TPR) repeat protein
MVASKHWTENYLGAYATPELVGRVDILARIDHALQQPGTQPQVLFLTGDGGIGKTRLLSATLEHAHSMDGLHAAHQVVDLYHVPTHTAIGLALEIADALNSSNELFPNYQRERRNLERLNLLGQGVGVKEQRDRTLSAFVEDMRTLAQTRRLVIALDTAERYVYGLKNAPIQIKQTAEAWTWLVNALPQWGNVIVVMAGRPAAETLLDDLAGNSAVQVTNIPVADFTEEESLAYFEAVSKVAAANGDAPIERRVANLPTHVRQMAHRYSGGRPILLALFIDYLSVTPVLLPEILRAPDSAKTEQDQVKLTEARFALENQIVGRLSTTTLGETIIALGRLPKGADREILAQMLNITEEEARERLVEVQGLSFVKIRPKDRRMFLHDEMYAILQRQVYAVHDDAAQAHATDAVRAYYRKQYNRCLQDLDRLYAPAEVEGKVQLDLERLAEVHASRQAILTEIIYYRLRQDAVRGYQRFYRYVRDAIRAGDTALDVQLQAELLAFQAEIDAGVPGRSSEGLDRSVVVWAVALRPVLRAFAEQNYRQMLEEARQLKEQRPDLVQAGAPVAAASLDAWLAVALTYLGGIDNFEEAYRYLTQSIDTLKNVLTNTAASNVPPLTVWRVKASLAMAFHYRGYLQRTRGYAEEAVDNYRQAAVLWRQTNIEVELANTLNDMGFATAELGYWSDAHDLVLDALQRRRQLGARVPVAMSYNTLARIAIHRGENERAIRQSEIALALFRALTYERGMGLSLRVLAEAKRRYSRTDFVPRPEDKINMLRAARQHATEAFEIFFNLGEKARQAESKIEIGCACRDWVWILQNNPNLYDDAQRLQDEGVKALNEAARISEDNKHFSLQIDALVDLAWLGMYVGNNTLIDDTLQRIEQAIPPKYCIDATTGMPLIDRVDAQVLLWPLIGKKHILVGHRAFEQYLKTNRSQESVRHELLCQTIDGYFWGLQYSALYGEHYIGIRRAKEEIYDHFKNFKADEMDVVAAEVLRLENEYHLGGQPDGSTLRQFLNRRALWHF